MSAPMSARPLETLDERFPSRFFVLKVASRCNINCTYCYMFNKGDSSYRDRPRFMTRQVAVAMLDRVFSYAQRRQISSIGFALHGGEPLLIGKEWVRWFLQTLQSRKPSDLSVQVSVQTNGTLLDREWVEIFARFGVHVGVSIDGPAEWHDQFRIGFDGKGTHHRTEAALKLLASARPDGPRYGVLSVANPGYDAAKIYTYFRSLGIDNMDFLWPEYHHDDPSPWPPGALSSYFIKIFEEWYSEANKFVSIRWFESTMLLMLGGDSLVESTGGGPVTSVVIESDGSLQPLDVLRTCRAGMTELGLNVTTHSVEQLRATPLFRDCLENEFQLADACLCCPEVRVCGGGYLPHRWGNDRGFRNPSVHCAELLTVIRHVRRRLMGDILFAQRSQVAS